MEQELSLSERMDLLENRVAFLEKKVIKPKKECWPMDTFREQFKAAWAARYQMPYPKWSVKENSVLKRFVTGVGREEAKTLIEAYLQWNDPFIVRCRHTLELLDSRVVELRVWMHDPKKAQQDLSRANNMRTKMNEREEVADHVRRIDESSSGRSVAVGGEIPLKSAAKISGPRGDAVSGQEDESW